MGKKINKEILEEIIKENPDWTQKQIADHLNLSISYIGQLIKKYNIDYKDKNINYTIKEELKKIINEHPDWSQREIAEHLGTEKSHVSQLIKKYNIDYTIKKKNKKIIISKEKLIEIINEHPDWTQKQIADHLGVVESYISRLIRKYNIIYVKKGNQSRNKFMEKNLISQYFMNEEIMVDLLFSVIKNNNELNQKEIADLLVKRLINEYNLNYKLKTITKDDLLDVIKEHPDWTQKQIADHFLALPNTINSILVRNNINQKEIREEYMVEKLKELIKEHPDWTQAQLAEPLGITKTYVRNLIIKYKLEYNKKKLK
ncbi:DNA binding protein [Bacillus phage AR9]|uniref:DNA binding protein n=1 Tax=Bacillus phage AR9 TaxID=1815509 RepID=A0A172JHT7_BPPB1|nr:DNA binding protein [Bacillus phage AR9]AMS01112.1 DNA binding protein [Bacillus phage AR9]